VFESRVLRRISGARTVKLLELGESCIMSSFSSLLQIE
jgi:hypothetical protein